MNQYYDVVSRAAKYNELDKLLGGDDKYIRDSNGDLYLAEDIRLTGCSEEDSDPMNLHAILSAIEIYYCKLNRKDGSKKRFREELVQSLNRMIYSENEIYLYFATKTYFILGKRDVANALYPFKGLYLEIKKSIEKQLIKKEEDLIRLKIYGGQNFEKGLWDVLIWNNNHVSEEVRIREIK